MAQVTRCPSCGTMFKVVADQLRISDGWVRCGHCAEVFDARLNMQSESGARADAAPAAPDPFDFPLRAGAASALGDGDEPDGAAVAAVEVAGDAAAIIAVEPELPEMPQGLIEVRLDEPTAASAEAVATGAAGASGTAPRAGAATAEQAQQLSFLRADRSQSFWRHPAVRLGLGLFALLLLLTLGLQLTVENRDSLAARMPQTQPWLERVCLPLACEVRAPRRLESLVIEGSSFSKVAPSVYRLGFAVRNNGNVETALPALELTLTNAQDQPLLRRVLKPQELDETVKTIRAGGEWSGNAMLRLPAGSAEIVGYRILAFYP